MNMHILVLAGAMALAQPRFASAQAGTNDPALARRAVPALRYDSAFADYKPWRDPRPADWRGVNDALATDDSRPPGGHVGHATAPARPPAAPTASGPAASSAVPAGVPSPAETAPNGHAGHGSRK